MLRLLIRPVIPPLYRVTLLHISKNIQTETSSTPSHNLTLQNSLFNEIVEAKNKNLPLEQIMQPIVEFKKAHRFPLSSNIYSFLIDLSSTDEEIDAVLSDWDPNHRFFRIDTVYYWDVEKLKRICDSIKRIQGKDSLISVLQAIVGMNSELELISPYIQDEIDFLTLIKSNNTLQLYLLEIILKLEHYDDAARQLKQRLLHDRDAVRSAIGEPTRPYFTRLKLMFLRLFMTAYRDSEEDDYLDQIRDLINDMESRIEFTGINDSADKSFSVRFGPSERVNFYQICLEKNNINLALKLFYLFYCKAQNVHIKDKGKYFGNLLHLQSLVRVRSASNDLKSLNEDPTIFINRDIKSDIKQNVLFPSASLFIGYLHSRMVDISESLDTFLSRELAFLVALEKNDEILEELTNWTQHYTPQDRIPNNIYCNMLYSLITVAVKMNAMLTPKHVADLLRRLTPHIRTAEEKKSFLKSVEFFDTRLDKIYQNHDTEVPMDIHSSIMFAFSRAKDFGKMKQKYTRIADSQTLGKEEIFALLISTAAIKHLEDECEFIYTKVWPHIKEYYHGQTIPVHLIERIIDCCIKTWNYQKAISFVEYALKNDSKISVKVIDRMLNRFHKEGKRNEINALKNALTTSNNLEYSDIIERIAIILSDCI